MWNPYGKSGLWVWNDDHEWLQPAVDAGMHYITLKAADIRGGDWSQYNAEKVAQVRAQGLACLAWTYVYMDDPVAEAWQAINAVQKGADGLIIDIEYEAVGKISQVELFVKTLRDNLGTDFFIAYAPDFRIAFGNRWPSGGFNPNAEPYGWEALNTLDAVMPQLYWKDFAQTPETTFDLSQKWIAGCQSMGWNVPPVYPVLPCTASADEITRFCNLSISQGYGGANLWRSGYGNWRACMNSLGSVQWPQENPEPQPDPVVVLLNYIGSMGAPDGEIVSALDGFLKANSVKKSELRNVRNRLVSLYNEATGKGGNT